MTSRWTKGPTLTDAQFARLRDLISVRTGLLYPDNKRYLLESRLRARLEAKGLKCFDAYLAHVDSDPNREEELTDLFSHITNNETSFYRNAAQFAGFQERVLPEIIENRRAVGQRRIKIWSAGCSSGEEAFTIAMMVCEVMGEEMRDWRVEIVASDLSASMIERAKEGLYGEYSMRSLPEGFRAKYFTQNESGAYHVGDKLRRLVRFSVANLNLDAELTSMTGCDAVFCRNVLIYFEPAARAKVVERLWRALAPGGWLFVGHSESLQSLAESFELVRLRGAVAYRKEGGSQPPTTVTTRSGG